MLLKSTLCYSASVAGEGGRNLNRQENKVETNKEEALHTHIQAAAQSIERHIYTALAWDDLLSD
jgi:hypothetical protein